MAPLAFGKTHHKKRNTEAFIRSYLNVKKIIQVHFFLGKCSTLWYLKSQEYPLMYASLHALHRP